MAEHVGMNDREIFDMGVIGVGEHVKRQALCRARQQRRDAGHFPGEDRVPPFEELGVGQRDAERIAQGLKIGGIADLAGLMVPIGLRANETLDKVIGLAAGMSRPAGDRLGKIDIEHDAAEIEQQRVGIAWNKTGRGHGAPM